MSAIASNFSIFGRQAVVERFLQEANTRELVEASERLTRLQGHLPEVSTSTLRAYNRADRALKEELAFRRIAL